VKGFFIGTLTDAISTIYFLLPMWLVLLFFNIENKIVKVFSLLLFLFGFTILCVLNPDYALGIVMRVESLIKQTLF
jgi:hypothetical protein